MTVLTITFQGHDVSLSDVDYFPGCTAKTNCLPEDSYPAESPEISFKIDTGIPLFDHLLEEHHFGEIEGLAFEAAEQSIKDAADEAACQKYDEWKEDHYHD